MTKTKIVTLTLVTLLASGSALAQQADPGYGQGPQQGPSPRGQGMDRTGKNDDGERPANQLERMTRRLDLTPEQKAKLEAILRQHEELRAAQREAMRKEVAAILTPEQLAKFEQKGPGRGGRMGRGMGSGGGQGRNAPVPGSQPQ
jgi:Spy/CpxP family protein refolding chaperone